MHVLREAPPRADPERESPEQLTRPLSVRIAVIGSGPLWRSEQFRDVAADGTTTFPLFMGATMNTCSTALDVLPDVTSDHEPHTARRRFGAIVRTLAQLRRDRAPLPASAPAVADDMLPTRRPNRIRRLLGRLPHPGKSRSHARRLR